MRCHVHTQTLWQVRAAQLSDSGLCRASIVARAHSCRRVSTLQMAGTVAATRAWGTLVRTAGVHAHGYNDSRGGAAIAVCTSVRAAGPRLREGRAGQLGEVA